MVDKESFPCDHPHSTLLLHPPGVACLHRWGLLERVLERSHCRKIKNWHVDVGPFVINAQPPAIGAIDFGIAPRRLHLDAVLVEAAREAGVEIRENYNVDDLLYEDGRVVGITSGSTEDRAKIVIGAEGPGSLVAKAVQAPEYRVRKSRVGTYWAFWSGATIRDDADMEFYPRVHRAVYAWPTSDNWLLVGANWRVDELNTISKNPEDNYLQVLEEHAPHLSERLKNAKRESEFRGGFARNFYRKPYGDGWALSGDAGCCYEFSTGQGITNVFRADELLAKAIHDGLSGKTSTMLASLAAFEQQRNDAETPYYDFTYNYATLQPPDEQTLQLYSQLANNEEMAATFLGLFAQTTSPTDFFSN